MFSSFRERLKAVQNDVISGIQRLSAPEPASPAAEREGDSACLAGARLLSQYQQRWSAIHGTAEHNIMLADEVQQSVATIRQRCGREHALLVQLQSRLQQLPQLQQKLQAMVASVSALQEGLVTAEVDVVELEHQAACEVAEDKKMREKALLANYRRSKQLQFEQTQVRAAQEHLTRTQERERRRLSEQAERHATFDRMARSELEQYRRHHTLDDVRPVGGGSSARALSLEEVDFSVEADADALDAFLADTQPTGTDPDPARQETSDSEPEDPARNPITHVAKPDEEPEDLARDPILYAAKIGKEPEDPAGGPILYAAKPGKEPEDPAQDHPLHEANPDQEPEDPAQDPVLHAAKPDEEPEDSTRNMAPIRS